MRRFSVGEYHRLNEIGILRDGDPYELLDGWIVEKMTHNPAHDVCVDLLAEVFMRNLPKGWRPRVQSAITLNNSEPEPDIAVVRGSARDFLKSHPMSDVIELVIEVADSSLERDRLKAQLYAHDKVKRYWLVNLSERLIEDYSQPAGKGTAAKYKAVSKVKADQTLSLTIGRKTVSFVVADVLP